MGKVGKFNNVQEIRLAKKTNFVEFIEDIWVYSEPAIIMISFSIGFMLCPSLKTGQTAGDLLYHKSRDTTGNSGYWGRGWVGGGGGGGRQGSHDRQHDTCCTRHIGDCPSALVKWLL